MDNSNDLIQDVISVNNFIMLCSKSVTSAAAIPVNQNKYKTATICIYIYNMQLYRY